MTKIQKPKPYNLDERTFEFAKNVRDFAKHYIKQPLFFNDTQQVIRSSGSVGANYIEANESLSKKDFRMRIKICRKEAKESHYWLRLLKTDNQALESTRSSLEQEAMELTRIFSAILQKSPDA